MIAVSSERELFLNVVLTAAERAALLVAGSNAVMTRINFKLYVLYNESYRKDLIWFVLKKHEYNPP